MHTLNLGKNVREGGDTRSDGVPAFHWYYHWNSCHVRYGFVSLSLLAPRLQVPRHLRKILELQFCCDWNNSDNFQQHLKLRVLFCFQKTLVSRFAYIHCAKYYFNRSWEVMSLRWNAKSLRCHIWNKIRRQNKAVILQLFVHQRH